MAMTVRGMEQVLYNVYIDTFAKDYAFAMAGSPVFSRDFDKAKYDEAYEGFKKAVDTPEKLMKWGAALAEAEVADD